jgi:LPPG:FO 2-phospho-L-lactate transferase
MHDVVVLSGGVGGARFVRGVVDLVGPGAVTVVGNVGDDADVLGLHVSPDLDSLLYALTDRHDEERGWGRRGETWHALETARELGDDETWFQLGDRDLGLHLVRTKALRAGEPLSAVTARLAAALGLEVRLLPATDDRLRTVVETSAGALPLQDWFVRRRHRDAVDGVRFEGAADARPAPGVVEAIEKASLVVIAPSNPYISIWPILAVGAIRQAVERRQARVVAVSPVIGGKAVKGPADAMLERIAGGTSPAHVAGCYPGLLGALVIDEADAAWANGVEALGVRPCVTRTLMTDRPAARELAETVLEAAGAGATRA